MRRILYFAYGSNLSSPRLRARIPGARVVGPARLAHHRLALDMPGLDGSAKANVVPRRGESVWGVLYALGPRELARLDRFEGGYARVRIAVRRVSGHLVEAVTYRALRRVQGWRPYGWYRDHLLRGAREHGLPGAWIARLEALPAQDGPPEDAAMVGPHGAG